MTNEELVERCMLDDTGAYQVFVERHERELVAAAMKQVGKSHAKDVVQQVVLELWNKRHEWRSYPLGLAKTILDRRCTDWLRRGSAAKRAMPAAKNTVGPVDPSTDKGSHDVPRAKTASLDIRNLVTGHSLMDDLVSKESSPEQPVLSQENGLILQSALDELPPDKKETIRLVFIDGLSNEECAYAQRLPSGTVRGRIRDGKKTLREKLKPHFPELYLNWLRRKKPQSAADDEDDGNGNEQK